MLQTDVTHEWPRWLKTIALSVCELLQQRGVRARFQEMARRWREEREDLIANHVEEPKGFADTLRESWGERDEDVHDHSHPVKLLPNRVMSLAENFATLAAIHDRVCECTKKIDPWAIGSDDRDMAQFKAGILYMALLRDAVNLVERDRPRLEGMLKDVTADVEHAGLESHSAHTALADAVDTDPPTFEPQPTRPTSKINEMSLFIAIPIGK